MWPVDKEKPEFGLLNDVKVVGAITGLAGPFAAQLLAENGADVIWIESPKAPDINRFDFSYKIENERRNMRNMSFNLPTEEGKKILFELLKDADVFMEGFKGDQMAKWGLTDEVLWEINPKLVIAHVSGYGQTGVPEYISRPSYDMIGQAFSGFMYYNSDQDGTPRPVGPQIADYVTALFNCVGILMAVHHARMTGKGESVDTTLFESMMRVDFQNAANYTEHRKLAKTSDPIHSIGCEPFKCKDGSWIYTVICAVPTMQRTCKFLGIEYGVEPFPHPTSLVMRGSAAGDVLDAKLKEYFASVTADEAAEALLEAGIPCSKINTVYDLENNPHVLARNTLETVTTCKGVEIKYVGPVPHMKNNPGKTWRRAPFIGEHNDSILAEIGYTEEQIAEMYESDFLKKDDKLLFHYPYKRPGIE